MLNSVSWLKDMIRVYTNFDIAQIGTEIKTTKAAISKQNKNQPNFLYPSVWYKHSQIAPKQVIFSGIYFN